MGGSSSFDNDGDLGVLFDSNCNSFISVSASALEHLCQGFGTAFCCACPYAKYIPDDCLMNTPDVDERISCIKCDRVCPCNRTYRYEDIFVELKRYEAKRVNLKIGQV